MACYNDGMKQRVRVVALCRKDDEILLLKRAAGRVEGGSDFELPTGKIAFGEQPEEAMTRAIYEYLSAKTASLRLLDVVTFTDLVDASEQSNLYIVYELGLEGVSVKITNERYAAYKWVKNTETEGIGLNEASAMVLRITATKAGQVASRIIRVEDERGATNVVKSSDFATVFTDGGSRGNPGPSGVGYYIVAPDGSEALRGGNFIGFSTSRLAEYYGLKEGIEEALSLGYKKINFKSDSLMLVNQMNGVYKVKNRDLMTVYNDVLTLLGQLEAYSFSYIPREKNREADSEVNRAIDGYAKE